MDAKLNQISHDDYLFSIDNYLPSAWLGHAPFLKFLIREQKPKVFLELGVHNGFSYFLGCQAIKECGLSTKSFAVDHWLGDNQAGYFDDSIFLGVASLNVKYEEFSTLFKMSFTEALKFVENQTVDLLHIDGYHSYEAVKEDFESWLCKMSENGIVLLHDIHVRRNTFGVFRFWEEIKKNYRTIEFVGSHGLGVVFLGKIPEGILEELHEFALQGNLSKIQGTFGSISDDVIQNSRNGIIAIAEAERDRAEAERDRAEAERDRAEAECDRAEAERDRAEAERGEIENSNIWKYSKLYRSLKSKITGS